MRISEVTEAFVREFIREDQSDESVGLTLGAIMPAAKAYILSHTGLTEAEADGHEDLTVAYLILIEDMYDNRAMTVQSANVNRTVDTILAMHSRNNIG